LNFRHSIKSITTIFVTRIGVERIYAGASLQIQRSIKFKTH